MAKNKNSGTTVAKPKSGPKVSARNVSRTLLNAVSRESREAGPLNDSRAFKSMMVKLRNGQAEAAKKAKQEARAKERAGNKAPAKEAA